MRGRRDSDHLTADTLRRRMVELEPKPWTPPLDRLPPQLMHAGPMGRRPAGASDVSLDVHEKILAAKQSLSVLTSTSGNPAATTGIRTRRRAAGHDGIFPPYPRPHVRASCRREKLIARPPISSDRPGLALRMSQSSSQIFSRSSRKIARSAAVNRRKRRSSWAWMLASQSA